MPLCHKLKERAANEGQAANNPNPNKTLAYITQTLHHQATVRLPRCFYRSLLQVFLSPCLPIPIPAASTNLPFHRCKTY